MVSQVVPEKELDSYVETLAKEIGQPQRRNFRERQDRRLHAKRPFLSKWRLKPTIWCRTGMRYYTNPLSDVEGYLHSQKGGGTVKYVKPEEGK